MHDHLVLGMISLMGTGVAINAVAESKVSTDSYGDGSWV